MAIVIGAFRAKAPRLGMPKLKQYFFLYLSGKKNLRTIFRTCFCDISGARLRIQSVLSSHLVIATRYRPNTSSKTKQNQSLG